MYTSLVKLFHHIDYDEILGDNTAFIRGGYYRHLMSFYYPTTGAGLILKRQKLQLEE